MRRLHMSGLALVITALLGAGCSGGTTNTGSTTVQTARSTTSVAPTSTSAATATTNPALGAKAAAAVFQPGDFPAAFKQQPDMGGDCPASAANCSSLALETVWHDITACLGVADTAQASATSSTYLQNLATQARSTVEYTSPSTAQAIGAAVAGAKFQGCATQAFTADAKRNAPQGATPGPVTITTLPAPNLGQSVSAVSAIRANITMHLQDLSPTLFQDFLVVVNGGTVMRFFFLNPGSPFPPNLQQSLLQKVVSRAAS